MFQKDKHLGELLLSILAWNLNCPVFPSCHSWCSNLRTNDPTQKNQDQNPERQPGIRVLTSCEGKLATFS